MRHELRTKYRKYFGDLFEAMEYELNSGANPDELLEKYKKIRKEQKRQQKIKCLADHNPDRWLCNQFAATLLGEKTSSS